MKKQVGNVVNTHGIKGELRVMSNSDFKDIRFATGNKLQIKGRKTDEIVEIESHYTHKNFDIVKLKGYDNINDVLKFKNCKLLGDKLGNEALGEGEFFRDDIIGLNVIDQDGNNVGKVSKINDDSYQKLLIIKTEKKNVMVPYVDEFVKNIDLENNVMTINVIPGLIDED